MSLNWFEPEYSSVLPEMLFLTALALIISSIGFYRVVYFISIGYAFSIVAMAAMSPMRHLGSLAWPSAMQNILLVLWGVRLVIYLVQREYRASYRKELADIHQRSAGMSWITKILIWASVSVLYVLMFSPSLFSLITLPVSTSWIITLVQTAGLMLMGGGLLLEAMSDKQNTRNTFVQCRSYSPLFQFIV